MEILDVETVEFTYQSRTVRDEKGHSHPGEPHEAVGTITKVVTDEDADGYCVGGDRAANDLAAEFVAGEDPMERERLWRRLNRTQRLKRGTLSDGALSRIDCALWDFAGRYFDVPVHRLLGGHRERVPAYASTMVGDDDPDGLGTPQAYADFAEALVERGYPAVKLHTWMPPYGADPERDLAACRAVRERVGDGMELMLDCSPHYPRMEARRLGRALEDLDFYWYEEPMHEHSMDAYRWLRGEVDVPICGPEMQQAEGKMGLRAEWIKHEACDVCRTGIYDVGGITPVLKTVGLCESFGMPLELHGGGAGHLQVLGAMGIPGEYYERGLLHPAIEYEPQPPWLNEPVDPMDDEGMVTIPQRPGLGHDIDWDYIQEHRVH
jgi:L-alanine-DL-glutamate epimerase-like enolase superfamily enzyme